MILNNNIKLKYVSCILFYAVFVFFFLKASSFAENAKLVIGEDFSIGLNTDGTLWAWGFNYYGQLGDGTIQNTKPIPIQVKSADESAFFLNAIAVGAGVNHSLAVTKDRTIWAWGDNYEGQLGDGTTKTIKSTPVHVKGPNGVGNLNNVKFVSGGYDHSIAVKTDGTVWAWGANYDGFLGDNTTISRPTPVQVIGPGGIGYLTNVKKISASPMNSMALKFDGTVWMWGNNYSGQLGDGSTARKVAPNQVKGPSGDGFINNIIDIDCCFAYAVALKSDGTVWTWGTNSYGNLGDGTTVNRLNPVQVKGENGVDFLSDIQAVAGYYDSCIALKSDGTVWAWGNNSHGQLGDGTTNNSNTPVQVKGPDGISFLDNINMIAGGGSFFLALKNDGTIWAWGRNDNGQLGDGTYIDKHTPVKVLNLNLGSNQTVRNMSAIYSLLLDDSSIKQYDFFEDFKTPTGWNLFLQEYENWFDASQHQSPSVEWNDPAPGDLSGSQVEIVNDQSYLRMKTEGGTYDRLKLMTNEKYTTGTYEWKVYFPNNMLEANGEGANTAYGAWLYDSFNTGREIDFEIGWGPRWQRQEAGLSDSDEKLLVHMTVQPSDSIIGDWEQPDGQLRTNCAVIDSGYWYTFKLILSNQNGNYLVEWYFKKEGEEYDSSPAHVFSCPYGPDDTSFHISVSNENFPAIWLGENAPPMEPHHAKFDFVRYKQ